MGKLVRTISEIHSMDIKINTNDLPEGIYFISVASREGGSSYGKFIVKKQK